MENTQLIEESSFIKLGQELRENEKFREVVQELEEQGLYRIILDRESTEPYLARYYYMNFRPFARIVIHNFLRSDIDGLHDHPWPFQNYILAGGYWEVTETGRFWRAPGDSGTHDANYFHRVELDLEKAGGETWTMFLMGAKEKDWGFLDNNNKWVQWEEHLNNKLVNSTS